MQSLLEKNPKDRLKDPELVKKHAWFNNIDWDKAFKKELEPPLRPAMGNLENFSKQLTKINVEEDLEEDMETSHMENKGDNIFDRFSFSRPSYIDEV